MENAEFLRCAKVLRLVKRKAGGVVSILTALMMLCTLLPINMVFAQTAAEVEEISTIPLMAEAHRSTEAPDIYVSPNGNDQTGDGSAQKPFKSLGRAKEAVQSLPKTGDIVVEFADGFYEMTETVEFGQQDSGSEDCTIYYQAAPGATPILSGGKKITGTWEAADDVTWLTGGLKAYKTTLDRNGKLRAIYVNGERANMTEKTNVRPNSNTDNIPRYSFYTSGETQYNPEEFYVAGEHSSNETAHIIRNQSWIWQDRLNVIGGTKFSTADLPPDTRNAQNIEFSAKVSAKWVWPLACVAKTEVDPADASRTIAHLQMPYNALAQSMDWGTAYSRTNTHVIYNVFEHLGKAGDFYFDEAQKTLYYIPRANESMESAEVVIPGLVHLIDIGGNLEHGSYVTNVTFSGLTFSHADWNLYKMGESYGYSTVQTCTTFIAMANGNWHNDMYRSYDVVPSAITVNKAKNIRFLDGAISFTGANGIHLENDVWDCEVTGNSVNRVGHAGVVVGHPQHLFENDPESYVVSGSPRAGTDREKFPRGTESVPRNIYVTNNYFYKTGYMFKNNNNFSAFFAQNLQVLHNFFFDVPCSPLMVGWGWWEFDGRSGSKLPGIPTNTSFNNKVNYNRMENYCMNVDDAGGIYSLGQQGKNDWTDSSEMNYNFMNGWREGTHTGWVNGFHPDEGSKFINFTGNVIQRISRSVYEFNNFNGKSDMNVYQGFADIPNLFGTEAPRTTLDLTVIPDRTWPQMGHDVVLNSGLTDEYLWMVQESVLSAADYELASRVQYRPGMKHNRRGLLSATDEVWIAPRNTTTFVEGDTMTKSAGNDKSMDIPSQEGTYTLYIRRANETVEVSQFDIVISGRPISEPVNVKEGEEYKVSAVKPLVLQIDDEYYENLRLNGRTVNNGDVIGTEGTWVLSIRNKETQDTFNYSFTTLVTDANKLLTEEISVAQGAEIQLNDIGLTNDVDLWIAGSGDSSLPNSYKNDPRRSWAAGSSTTIKAPNTPGVYALHVAKNETSDSAADAHITVINGVREIADQINADDVDLWTNAAWDNATELEVNQVAENKKVGREPATGKAKLLWGDDKLYVRVDVTDDDINSANSATYLQDSVEVYLSEMNFKGSYNGTQGNQYRVTAGGNYGAKTGHTGVTYNSMQTSTGYSIFLSLPSRNSAFSDKQVISFDVQINDATTPENDRTGQTTWSDPAANGYSSSAEWGELVLLGVRPKLTDLSISTGKLKPDFDPNIKEYTVSVGETISTVEITAAGKAGTTIAGDGSQSLTDTLTELQVIVTDTVLGIANTYKIKVTKVPSVVPKNVPQNGLDLWLMADKGVTAGADDVVTSWVNQVTTGAAVNAAFTPNAPEGKSFQPKLINDSDKGYSYVYFDGTPKAGPISLKNNDFKDYNGKTELTVITVALPESNPNSGGDQTSAVWMGESGGWGGTYFGPGATEVKMRLGSGATAPSNGGPMTSSFTRTAPTALVTDAFVFDNGTHTLYENGEQKTTDSTKLTPMARNQSALNIGGTSSSYGPAPFKGQLAEVLLYDRALTPAEILAIQTYVEEKYFPEPPITGVPEDGLDLWLMADNGVTTDIDGVVTSWVNQATTGAAVNAAFTPTAANFQPKLMTDSDKGYKYVNFDGEAIAGPVSLKSTGFKDYNGKTELTVITVAKPESNPNSNGDQGSAVWMGESGGWGGTYFGPGATTVNMRLGSGASASNASSQSSSFTRTTPTELVMDAFVFDNGTHTLYENGIQKTTATGKNTPIARNLTDLNIGGTSSSSNPAHFKGQLAEVLVYDRALSPEEITSIQEFMADKYSEKSPVGSSDATLQSLGVSSGTLTPSFSPDVFNYTAEVSPDVDSIIISALATDENATVIGDVTYPLNVGQNSLYVVVTSEDGEVELTYKIVVTRTPNSISASELESFGTLTTPYTQPAAKTVTITNTGTNSVTLEQPTSTGVNYEIGELSETNLAPAGQATFTVQPKADLSPGNYDEIITIHGTGEAETTVNASFTVTSETAYSITVTSGQALKETAVAGEEVTIVADEEPAGKVFKVWQFDVPVEFLGGTDASSATVKISMPASDVNAEATYEDLPESSYTITVTSGGNGLAIADVNYAQQGEPVTVTATPNAGYIFKEWQVISGVTLTGAEYTQNPVTFMMPDNDVELKAVFKAIRKPSVNPSSRNQGDKPKTLGTINEGQSSQTILSSLKKGDDPVISLSNNIGSVKLAGKDLLEVAKAGKELTIVKGNNTISLTSEALKALGLSDKSKVTINLTPNSIPEETLQTLIKADPLNKELTKVSYNIGLTVDNKEISSSESLFKVTVDMSGMKLTEAQKNALTGIIFDEETGTYRQLGGEFNDDGTFTFYSPSAGEHSLIVSDNLKKVCLQIGQSEITVNKEKTDLDVAPVIRNDRTIVPLRAIAESLNAQVDWDSATRTVTITLDGKTITLELGKSLPNSMGMAELIDNRTFVPLRYIAEQLGANVLWDGETKVVTIYK